MGIARLSVLLGVTPYPLVSVVHCKGVQLERLRFCMIRTLNLSEQGLEVLLKPDVQCNASMLECRWCGVELVLNTTSDYCLTQLL